MLSIFASDTPRCCAATAAPAPPCTSAFLSHIRKHFLCQLRLHFIVLQQSLARVACASSSSYSSIFYVLCFLARLPRPPSPWFFHWVSGSLGFGLTARLKLRLSIAFNSLYSWRFDLSLTTNRETEKKEKTERGREREREKKSAKPTIDSWGRKKLAVNSISQRCER